MPSRIAVLASGRGSNLEALLGFLEGAGTARSGEVVVVASDRASAGALAIAASRGIATAHVDAGAQGARELGALLDRHRVDLIVLAGYLRLVPPEVVQRFAGRVLNVHPALLPAFGGPGMYGERVHRAVLASGARVSGPTVHFVDEVYDRGAIIAQWPVPVMQEDTPHSLAERVLRVEHLLLPRVVNAVAGAHIRLGEDARVEGLPPAARQPRAFTTHTGSDDDLARDLDALFSW